ncbi:hypothetical protein FHS14_001015 [Paenibacillus baekrokdamisoli]|nr:hypothetical protein [Paenibacillus baekrokdamisoli]MBB3068039.1 hypothetical protein [Paenibacillus baekrokdamisoli]
MLQIPSFDAGCIRIRDGQSEQFAAWQPYASAIGERAQENGEIETTSKD